MVGSRLFKTRDVPNVNIHQMPIVQIWLEMDLARFTFSNPTGVGFKSKLLHRTRQCLSIIEVK